MTCNSTERICVGNDSKTSSSIGAGWFIGIHCLLLAAALISDVMTAAAQIRLCNDWRNSPHGNPDRHGSRHVHPVNTESAGKHT